MLCSSVTSISCAKKNWWCVTSAPRRYHHFCRFNGRVCCYKYNCPFSHEKQRLPHWCNVRGNHINEVMIVYILNDLGTSPNVASATTQYRRTRRTGGLACRRVHDCFSNSLEIEAQLYNRDYTKDSRYYYTKVCIVSIVIPHYTKGIGNKSIMIQPVGIKRECIICKIYATKQNIHSIVSVDGS